MNKKEAIDFAAALGWTKADAKRALDGVQLPTEEVIVLNTMVRFAGPELLKRQHLQAAQKAQVTYNKRLLEEVELQFADMVEDYEGQFAAFQSKAIAVIAVLYSIAKLTRYRDPWIEGLLATYTQRLQPATDEQKAA
ncbi:hypothetical protein GS597_09000 [Synechococcales cyanobacterium C]|uniref:Uncharacterized protein n=1 Tax=Petrachloros mirabilis ULC683 TaxID=2781853 RepID=A0A8K2A7X0_9CYAN|nr:hypothetical protein [Petrachloros mirabilis]NCJ06639.1 hypothetical protein [Petrachloros mirabilis ULC683]